MNNGNFRINLIVTDLLERFVLPQRVIIKRESTIYNGSITRIPKELLNESVIKIRLNSWSDAIIIELE